VGDNGSPVFFVYPELVVSLSNHCRGATLSLVEWVFNPLFSTLQPRLLAIVWSRDGLFSPPVLFGFVGCIGQVEGRDREMSGGS